jgi:hypothetical protein
LNLSESRASRRQPTFGASRPSSTTSCSRTIGFYTPPDAALRVSDTTLDYREVGRLRFTKARLHNDATRTDAAARSRADGRSDAQPMVRLNEIG